MKLVVEKTPRLEGTVTAPPSKSHTHRAIIIASLADGRTTIRNPLMCDDTAATIEACGRFGAKLVVAEGLQITGVNGKPKRSDLEVHVRNSGTTMRFMAAVFALCEGATTLTGDESLRTRPIAPLLKSLADLGAKRAKSLNNDGNPPICVAGKMKGGRTTMDGHSSQFVSALLLACPLAKFDSDVTVQAMNSRPYVSMTLEHMGRCGVRVINRNLEKFFIPAGQSYRAGDYTVPGDYSSAAFLRAAAVMTDSDIEIRGLDLEDVQSDRAFSGMIAQMMSPGETNVDLRDNPDLLPILAVAACSAEGITVLRNAPHARKKESDRISAICSELRKMGADIEEFADGMKVQNSKLKGAEVNGHGDHRIVMALAVAGLAAEGRTIINGADVISKSYPGFVKDLKQLGANIRAVEE
jgi:3-phosphoshikimate 1-carboxyvinyltransferase